MNIFALKGHKVKCSNLSKGYPHQQQVAKNHLNIGQEYTIEKTEVDAWSTNVWLQEFPTVKFNSVFFEDVYKQPKELTQLHPDYIKYM